MKSHILIVMSAAFLLGMLAGCAAHAPKRGVAPDDRVAIHYVCKNQDGQAVDANDPVMAAADGAPRSYVFRVSEEAEPLVVTAGRKDDRIEAVINRRPLGFREHLSFQLAEKVVGLNYGERFSVTLTAEEQKALHSGARYLSMARVRRRAKQQILQSEVYAQSMERQAAVGDEVPSFPGFVGKVASVTADQVVVINLPETPVMRTDFGPGRVVDQGDYYTIEMAVREGDLVRSGDNFGRIVAVRPKVFYVDFGHPYGGDALSCDIRIEPSTPAAPESEAEPAAKGEKKP